MKSITYARVWGAGIVLAASLFIGIGGRSAAAISDEEAIRELFVKQTAAWNRGDTLAFMEPYWKSPETEFAGASGILRGWDTVMARYRRVYPDAKAMGQLSFSGLEIKILAPDAAYAVGEFHLAREKEPLSGVFTLVLRKFPEGWRIVHDHSTAYPTEESKNGK